MPTLPSEQEPRIDVRVALPLPLDIAQTVMAMFGAVYPSTTVRNESSRTGRSGDLILSIAESDRRRSVDPGTLEDAQAFLGDGADADVMDLDASGGITLAVDDAEPMRVLHTAAAALLLDSDAPNYLEFALYDQRTGDSHVVVLCRSPEQTPHQLREDAERRLTEAQHLLDEVRALARDTDSVPAMALHALLGAPTTPDVDTLRSQLAGDTSPVG